VDRSESSREPHVWPVFVVVAIAAAIAYAPSFNVPFQFDDEARLLHNEALLNGRVLDAIRWLGNSRAVPSLTFVFNYQVGAADPTGYHVVNFLVHLLTTLGVFALALTLCRAPLLFPSWPLRRARLLAGAAAFLFACHPLQTQAVTYIIQRYASMAALFYVWAVVGYLRARIARDRGERRAAGLYFLAAVASAVCAVLSKEHTVSLPAALLLVELIGFGRPRWRTLAACSLAALAIVAIPIVWKVVAWEPAIKTVPVDSVPLMERLNAAILMPRNTVLRADRPSPTAYFLTEATVLPRYLGLVLLPWGLNVDHDVPFVPGVSPAVVAGWLFLAALALFGAWLLPRAPLGAFGILWFFITLSVESSVLPIDDAMVEHRMYLPMAGLAVSAGWLFALAVARAPRTAKAAGIVAAAALVALSFARNVVWLSPQTLWLDAVEKSPGKARPHSNLGGAYYKANRLNDAVDESCRALALAPDDATANQNLDLALTLLGAYDSVVPEVVERRPDGSVVLALPAPVTFCQ
jgi:hypothetical protein